LAGPGAITSVILTASTVPGRVGFAHAVTAMWAVITLAHIIFLTGPLFEKVLRETGINVATRVLGMILAALSVQFVLDGLISFYLNFVD
jgi:multiple antibiotic resistance protein